MFRPIAPTKTLYLTKIFFPAVNITGNPQPFNSVKTILPKENSGQTPHSMLPKQWEKHLNELKKLSIFASQAAEYEYNKNKTEGKTGIVKPDLIPSTKKCNVSESHLTTNFNASNVSDLVKTITSPRTSPRTSPLKAISELMPEEQTPVDKLLNINEQISSPIQSTSQKDKSRPKLVRSKGSLIKTKPPNILVYSDSNVSRDCVISTLKDIVKENT